jgi:hypothetical protein
MHWSGTQRPGPEVHVRRPRKKGRGRERDGDGGKRACAGTMLKRLRHLCDGQDSSQEHAGAAFEYLCSGRHCFVCPTCYLR